MADPMYGNAPEVEEGTSPFGLYGELTAPTSIQAFMGFNATRISNTMMKGGFLDTDGTNRRFFRRNNTLRRFRGSGSSRTLTGLRHSDMVGSRMPGSSVFGGFMGRRRKLADLSVGHSATGIIDNLEDISRGLTSAGPKGVPTPKFRPRNINHLDPRSMFRLHSTSAVSGAPGMYSPVGAMAKTLGGVMQHTNIGKQVMGEATAFRKAMSSNIGGTVGRGLLAEGKSATDVGNMLRHRGSAEDVELMSGGLMGQLRFGSKVTKLERKIAARQAAGKDVTKLTKKLATAQQSVKDLHFLNNPGVDPFNTKQVTLREVQAAQVNARTTAGKKASTSLFGSPGTHRAFGPGMAKEAYFMEGVDNASNRVVNISKTASGGFEAVDEVSGKRITLSNEIGASLYGPEGISAGKTANLAASAHKGQLTQRIHGYINATMGYGNAGGLSGQALAGAQSAQRDMVMLMERMQGQGVGTRTGFSTRAGRVAQMRAEGRSLQMTGREFLEDIARAGADDATRVRKFCCSTVAVLFFQKNKFYNNSIHQPELFVGLV